ncbi:protein-L-isoaspartate O-methyltransferase [Wenzhouxiangella sp. AB-CW3]|uniref:protein-L-isoaspartate O-methyltransferase family protein n=1 Tax=Wenzhouxiangella sp. AB-CW3 TaxID=2771012 RepID=UPI00168B186A|nr:protein-L-isoaspartate O-methyltransferase [Wenzhouxiangella sp. AB-CW3]QOC21845.1 protein-L-isoaspartate O-methyltransferase [Wenzhouxiangella sp. AB-CW3]
MSLNIEQARYNMVEQQVRPWEVLDPVVLEAMREVPREDFVPSRHRRLAFSDLRIPLPHDQVMMKPVEEGRMLQALQVEPGQRVLEIGTGSGFCAACLAWMGARVTTIEIHADLADSAHLRLERQGMGAVEVICADALQGFQPAQLFDVVVVTASAADVPDVVHDWVGQGGRIFAVRGCSPAMEAVCQTHVAGDRWQSESLFETDLPRLIGLEDQPVFEF